MNFSNILNEIAKVDPEVFEKTDQRRNVLKNMTRKVALTALPFAVGSVFNKAYGKTTDEVIDALNFALTLEHLEAEFYKKAVADASALFPSALALGAFQTIRNHEIAHVDFLTKTISNMGGTPNAANAKGYDFTLNGALDTFTDYKTLLTVAQVFEDTGVRAYKGQAGILPKNEVLTAALNIHSVEARHASHIRQMRAAAAGGGANVRPWVTGAGITASGAAAAFNDSYVGEDTSAQAGVNIVGIGGQAISIGTATEAFDEPLLRVDVEEIVKPFFIV